MIREHYFSGPARDLASVAWRARKERLRGLQVALHGRRLTLSYEVRHPSEFLHEAPLLRRLTDGLAATWTGSDAGRAGRC